MKISKSNGKITIELDENEVHYGEYYSNTGGVYLRFDQPLTVEEVVDFEQTFHPSSVSGGGTVYWYKKAPSVRRKRKFW